MDTKGCGRSGHGLIKGTALAFSGWTWEDYREPHSELRFKLSPSHVQVKCKLVRQLAYWSPV